MKKLIIAALAVVCMLGLIGCNNEESVGPGRPIAAYIGDYVTAVDITHHIAGKTTQWVATGAEIESLRVWLSELKYELVEFEDGQSPGDNDGGETFDFSLTEGDYPGFSYIINGTDDCYLLIESYWYSVANPSIPPVTNVEIGAEIEEIVIGSRSNETVNAVLSDIVEEEIVSARFDSTNPNYMYDIEDLTIIDGLLATLDGATYEVCERPKEPWFSIEAIYITTNKNEYYLGVIENSAFRISVNGEGEYYTCSHKDDFQNKLLELQGR